MRLLFIALFLVVGSVSLLWAAFTKQLGFSLDMQLKPLELLTLAVNIFIAFFLQYYLASRASETRAEKDLLILNISEAIKQLRTSRDLVHLSRGGPINLDDQSKILSALRILANEIENLATVMRASDCKKLIPQCSSLEQDYLGFKAAATGEGFPTKAYSVRQISAQERAYRHLNSELQNLTFNVNRHR